MVDPVDTKPVETTTSGGGGDAPSEDAAAAGSEADAEGGVPGEGTDTEDKTSPKAGDDTKPSPTTGTATDGTATDGAAAEGTQPAEDKPDSPDSGAATGLPQLVLQLSSLLVAGLWIVA